MEERAKKEIYFPILIQLLYLSFFISLFFSFRAITSISIGLLLVIGIIYNWREIKQVHLRNPFALFLLGMLLYLLLHLLTLTYTSTSASTYKDLQLKSALILIPVTIYLSGLNIRNAKRLIRSYCILLAVAMIYCLLRAIIQYFESNETTIFYYYNFARLIKQHPVYLSIYLFAGLVFLFESMKATTQFLKRPIAIFLIVLFSLCVFLLSSKLVISFYLLYLLVFFISQIRKPSIRRNIFITFAGLILAGLALLLFTKNPVSSRFRDLVPKDISLLKQEQFTPGDYFNGIEFRLLQWKLVPEILNEEKAWLTGVGVTAAQPLLDKQYLARNMYAGNTVTGTRGYPGYNTHNQFLESLLKLGIPGLALFTFICFTLVFMAWKSDNWGDRSVILLLLTYALVESVLETQYGIVLFSFFPSFIYLARREPTF